MVHVCTACKKEFIPKRERYSKFCSQSCAVSYNNSLRGIKRYCAFCNEELNREKGQKQFCSHACQQKYQSQIMLDKWLKGDWNGTTRSGKFLSKIIRDYLLEKNSFACERCGWDKINPITNKSTLQIHHKDGNYKNNSKENLEVLCPNCHSLTETFGAINKGNGRGYRYKE